MKVRCKDGTKWVHRYKWIRKYWWSKKVRKPTTGPKEGDILTVEGDFWREGEKYYKFIEWPGDAFPTKHFTPIDEEQAQYTEVELSKIKEKVPMPSKN